MQRVSASLFVRSRKIAYPMWPRELCFVKPG